MSLTKVSLIVVSILSLINCGREELTPSEKIAHSDGLVAFWDFQNTDHNAWQSYFDEKVIDRSFPLYLRQIGDPTRYHHQNWPYKEEDAQLKVDISGPFKHAVRFNQGYVYGEVPRVEFDQTLLDLSGKKPFTMIAWAKFMGNRHMIAGIWDEGGWNKYSGKRQAALFAGLFNQKGVIGHISSTGAASFPQSDVDGAQYARLRAIDGKAFDNDQWVAVAMTFDPQNNQVLAYLNGQMTALKLPDPVTQDVMQFEGTPSSNPFEHKYPLYSPTAFQLKYNGYDFHNGPVKEHRIWVDLNNASVDYEFEGILDGTPLRIKFDILRKENSILSEELIFDISSQIQTSIPFEVPYTFGDVIITQMEKFENEQWQQIGTSVERQIMEGAPFTFGRALGLDLDTIDHGSVELYLDGVAVFNRVLSAKELQELSFVK
ncbi:MAG: hypothetical protein HOH19_15385 [Kordiimonadaceae bacterium]|jgi:hypothetical protein|nr:hypothetical protein [Kordiimonadaceae bacterium]MBT6033953.1 hypothetical protein [Kordiimonadaceae bacterium]